MNALYQYKPLIYRERPTLKAFLEENPLWEELRNFYLKNSSSRCAPIVKMFNEARYWATKALLEKPGQSTFDYYYRGGMKSRFLNNSSDSEIICIAIAYALLRNQGSEARAAREVFSSVLLSASNRLYIELSYSGILNVDAPRIDLRPMPESPHKITRDVDWWEDVTEGWNKKKMEEIIDLWPFWERNAIKKLLQEVWMGNEEGGEKRGEEVSADAPSSPRKALPITAFLDYVEKHFPADRNADARVVKELLLALYTDMSREERERVNCLGTKPLYGPTTVHTGGGAAIINSELKEPKFHSN